MHQNSANGKLVKQLEPEGPVLPGVRVKKIRSDGGIGPENQPKPNLQSISNNAYV